MLLARRWFTGWVLTASHRQYPAVEPERAPTSFQYQPSHAMAGPSYVASGDVYFPQQMLPVGGMYHQAAPIAYGPTYG